MPSWASEITSLIYEDVDCCDADSDAEEPTREEELLQAVEGRDGALAEVIDFPDFNKGNSKGRAA